MTDLQALIDACPTGGTVTLPEQVTFQGAVWESVIDANVWSPTGYPAGWKAV